MRSYDVESFDRAYETTFLVSGVADVGPLSSAICLMGTDVAITSAGEHTSE